MILWLGVAVGIIWIQEKREGIPHIGLTLGYVGYLWQLHWTGGVIQLPESPLPQSEVAIDGFMESLWAIMAFAIGSGIVTLSARQLDQAIFLKSSSEYYRLSKKYAPIILAGGALFAYIISFSPIMQIPSITSIISAGKKLLLVSLYLYGLFGIEEKDIGKICIVLIIIAIIPFITVIQGGFLFFGAFMSSVVLVLLAKRYAPKWHLIAVIPVFLFFGLSLFMSYQEEEQAIRSIVWGGGELEERVAVTGRIFENPEWFDPTKEYQLAHIQGRMSQNLLLGQAISRTTRRGNYGEGETIKEAFLSVIPRAIWPEKPAVAGGHELASKYTGRSFYGNTSVGVGHVMELYVNFGRIGVIFGFLAIGMIVAYVDIKAGRALLEGRWGDLTIWLLVGIPLLLASQPIGNIPNQMVAGFIVGWGVKVSFFDDLNWLQKDNLHEGAGHAFH
ncbi:hypothetical protein GGQ02_003125 [Salinibacter ruber]|nr:hypothetical protein [Salinibacter ruber]